MCGRYVVDETEEIYERFLASRVNLEIKPNFNVAPSQRMPVVLRNSPNRVELMQWGMMTFWTKPGGKPLINVRDDTIRTKPWAKHYIETQRCLVPASGFYEWKKTDEGKVPHYIRLKSGELFAFAGLYATWHDEQGREVHTYTIITTEPNALMYDIHDRMPVILKKEDEDAWVDPDNHDKDRLLSMLIPYSSDEMEAYPVSRDVNSPRNNSSSLVERDD